MCAYNIDRPQIAALNQTRLEQITIVSEAVAVIKRGTPRFQFHDCIIYIRHFAVKFYAAAVHSEPLTLSRSLDQ